MGERPTEDWRRAFAKLRDGMTDQIRQERQAHKAVDYDVDGRILTPGVMDDEDIRICASEFARKSVERAINEHNHLQATRVRDRKGRAR